MGKKKKKKKGQKATVIFIMSTEITIESPHFKGRDLMGL